MNEFEVDFNARRNLKQRFYARGLEISQWALEHGFSRALVYGVLSDRTKGQRGEAHRIAVALGLKQAGPADAIGVTTDAGKED